MSDAPGSETLLASDGTTIAYRMQGKGPALLLLHGFGFSAKGWWRTGAAQRLAETRCVIAPDFRAHGESGKPTEASAYGRRLLTDLAELLDHESAGPADVVGFSMGAEIGLALAVHHPDRVGSLTLSGSGWSPPEIMDEYRKWFDRFAKGNKPPPNAEALQALILGMPELIGLDAETVADLPMPIRGIIGEQDDERPYMERITQVRPDFVPKILPGLDHLGLWRSPDFPDLLARAVNGSP
jgi:pimeloyl-ACP methyl ester carboxylesterase